MGIAGFVLGSPVAAQTVLSDQFLQVETMSGESVEMLGRSELRVTGNGTPLVGCQIDLRSEDSWVFLTNVAPSSAATLLGQFEVEGAGAVLNGNVRVVQYGQGAVVIPHPSDYRPLTVFDGENFSGDSMELEQYATYGTAELGAMASRFSSFILKRGYTATFAQNTDGSGRSRNYVAADGDLEIGALPDWMNDRINFVRVFPWRWTSKKGSCDAEPGMLDADWHYNWDINKSSTLDWEYAGIRQSRWWPGLNQNWQSRGIHHLSGYNEPGNPVEDAYTSLDGGQVGLAVSSWSDLLATGLRVGAPAVTDGGRSWLYDFMSRADAAGKRVDYVPVHFYWSYWNNDDPWGAANQLYQFLKEIHDRVQRPIWVTEFNNGANWTGNDPTTSQNRNVIQAMIQMMDDTPWIERYAIYGNVEWTRDVHYNDGSLTPMGQMYRDHRAPISYVQEMKKNRSRVASYDFEGSCRDLSGCGNHGIAVNLPQFGEGRHGQAIELGGACRYVQLPGDIANSESFSFASWVYWNGGGGGQRIFDFGNYDQSQYMVLSPNQNGGLSFALRNGGGTDWVSASSPLPEGSWQHVAVTVSGATARIYLNGEEVATGSLSPAALSGTHYNYLGKSQWPSDPLFSGKLDDVHIANYALSQQAVSNLMDNSMEMELAAEVVTAPAAAQEVPYSGSVAGTASDPDGSEITYYKIYGPSWLEIAPDGSLSGAPGYFDEGEQWFTVRAVDAGGERRHFMLSITLPVVLGDGTWSVDEDGLWSEAGKWSGGIPANGPGYLADFSTLNIRAARTVTLDGSHKLGAMAFGDTSGIGAWTIAAGGGVLTLESGSADLPWIEVENGTATLEAGLAGESGFRKSGAGTLVLAGASSLGGTVEIDAGTASGDGGVVRAAYPSALAHVDTLRIRNNNGASSTLELDGGVHGDVISPAGVELNGRNVAVPAIRNVAGHNGLMGGITTDFGGTHYLLQSDAGVLDLGGAISSAASGASRTWTFQGDGDFRISGVIENGDADSVEVRKTGGGGLIFERRNTYSGATSVVEGELVVNGTTGEGSTSLAGGTVLSGGGIVQADLVAGPGSTVRVGGEGLPLGPDSPFELIDDFQGYASGSIGATPNRTGNVWTGVFDGTANAVIVPSDGNQAMGVNGIPSQPDTAWRGAVTGLTEGRTVDFSLPDGETGTYFLRVRSADVAATDFIFGFSDRPASTGSAPGNDLVSPWNEYAVTLSVRDGNLRANAGGSGFVPIAAMTNETWINVWVIVDNAAKTYRVATSFDLEDGTLFAQSFDFGRRVAGTVGSSPLVSFGLHEQLDVRGEVDDLHFAGGESLVNPLKPGERVPKAALLTVEDDFTLDAGSVIEWDVSTGALHDRLRVGGVFDADGTLKVTLDPERAAPVHGDRFELFEAGTASIDFEELDLPDLGGGLEWDVGMIGSGVLEVSGVPGSYDLWAETRGFDAGEGGPTDDANGNGMENVLEWLFGSDPLVGGSAPASWPEGSLRAAGAGEFAGADPTKRYLRLTATVRKSTPGWHLVAQAAASPGLLDEAGSSDDIVSRVLDDLGDFEVREWIHTIPVEAAGKGFMRLKFTAE